MLIEHPTHEYAGPRADLMGNTVGEIRVQRLFDDPADPGRTWLVVYCEPGARTWPHVHRSGQVLHVLSGLGVIVTSGERRIVTPGDIVRVRPGMWHWHGALSRRPFCHLAVQGGGSDLVWSEEHADFPALASEFAEFERSLDGERL
ncbi:hypothetical protein DAETH_36650 (plasmid) [Deinococcus aetherius]|uniref:Cupin type-2 domain-containing protein n=1 Tax=Deinococcus aetherius TaxID=200252 RepID=A0ABM8AJ15_9DEIO|nr:cupin domain-containing protein [Deinococcus aetherius]BDP43696.1 hypothetical protein DAETH_36650 [Deinococcus aetherius]